MGLCSHCTGQLIVLPRGEKSYIHLILQSSGNGAPPQSSSGLLLFYEACSGLDDVRNSPQFKTTGAWGVPDRSCSGRIRGLGKYIIFLLSPRQNIFLFVRSWALGSSRPCYSRMTATAQSHISIDVLPWSRFLRTRVGICGQLCPSDTADHRSG